jgi:hypothetical protein
MKLSLPFLVFTGFATTDVVAGKKKAMEPKKLRGNKNVLNQDGRILMSKNNTKLESVPSRVDSDRDLQQDFTTKIVGGGYATNGEYPYFGELAFWAIEMWLLYIYQPK